MAALVVGDGVGISVLVVVWLVLTTVLTVGVVEVRVGVVDRGVLVLLVVEAIVLSLMVEDEVGVSVLIVVWPVLTMVLAVGECEIVVEN